jgi:hypothetical protein
MSTAHSPVRRHEPSPRHQRALAILAVLLFAAFFIILLVDRIFFNSSGTHAGTGSGVAATQARSLPPFTGIVLAGENNVIVHVGSNQSVIVHADSNLLKRVTTRVRSRSLVIGTTPGNLSARSQMFVEVGLPSLDALVLRGAGNIDVTGIDSRSLAVVLPGSGAIKATGTATRLDVTIVGSGTALLSGLTAQDAKAAISGSGSIMLSATRNLRATVAGTGSIIYGGNPPDVTSRVTGTGTIISQ